MNENNCLNTHFCFIGQYYDLFQQFQKNENKKFAKRQIQFGVLKREKITCCMLHAISNK